MINTTRGSIFGIAIGGLLFGGLLTLTGCGVSQVGSYQHEVRVKRGLDSATEDALQPALEIARGYHKGFTDKLQLKARGRYWHQDSYHQFEGDWWIADDGRLAIRTTHQDGFSLNALVSEGADRHYEIGDDGNLYRYWNSPDSNLVYVFVKQ